MIKIDWKAFTHRQYWFGWYYVTNCPGHKRYQTGCEWCDEGIWGSCRQFKYVSRSTKLRSYVTLGTMTENSLRFVNSG